VTDPDADTEEIAGLAEALALARQSGADPPESDPPETDPLPARALLAKAKRLWRRGPREPDDPDDPAPAARTAQAAARAFDDLYERYAPDLTRQVWLLTDRHDLARQSVEHAFHSAWEHWPDVARARDPHGWLRSVAYDYALSPWHRFRPGRRRAPQRAEPFGAPEDRELFRALLELPPCYRRTLLLYDAVGLDLPEAAAEAEATTPAAAGRLDYAHAVLARTVPELRDLEPEEQTRLLHERLHRFADAQPVRILPFGAVRHRSERRTERFAKRTVAGIAVLACAVAVASYTADPIPVDKAAPVIVEEGSGPR
jgi:DNA-directed RNA polymerase specialized sigma24 family protein